MKDLKGTRTEANLYAAYSGESGARQKYTIYADRAKKQGFEQIAAVFEETANNERAHAELWFRFINGETENTAQNLKEAAGGEHYEWSDMYKKFAEEAEQEGFADIARLFKGVADIEREHETRYLALMQDVEEQKVFKKDQKITWFCRNCGYMHEGDKAPEKCPICSYPKAYFEPYKKKY